MENKGKKADHRPVLYFSKDCNHSTKLRLILKCVPELAKNLAGFDVALYAVEPSSGVTHTPAIHDLSSRREPYQMLDAFKWVYAKSQQMYKNGLISEEAFNKVKTKYNAVVNPNATPSPPPDSPHKSTQTSQKTINSPQRMPRMNDNDDSYGSINARSTYIRDLYEKGKMEKNSPQRDREILGEIERTISSMPEPVQRQQITRESNTPKKPITPEDLERIVKETENTYSRN